MASIMCLNGAVHTHHSVYESKVCYGIIAPPRPASPVVPQVTGRQLDYIKDLGGDLTIARRMSRADASSYIDKLRKRPKEANVTTPTAILDPRAEMVKGLIPAVPKGYYAVGNGPDEGALYFVFVNRPTSGKYKGAVKLSTQHGDRWVLRGVLWPSGSFSILDKRIIDALMLIVPDHIGAAIRYGQQVGHCARCNAQLTDARSRLLTIGPECEKLWPAYVEEVEQRLALAASN